MQPLRTHLLRFTWLFFFVAAIACGGATEGDDAGDDAEEACKDGEPRAGDRCAREDLQCGPYSELKDCSKELCDGRPSSSFTYDVSYVCRKGTWFKQGYASGCCL